ncbi:hypothetical protein COV04_00170 [Candidatus Uhrbacteria bacterium CG10_big_fil_rev_8_21_14_0_10_48_11]|uniref:Uncharacterized protein n=1 Tax=Candidatus Uhrbacteria bacterium CG10_big_fil_rev_8_21_14_0_10_48_11 TaxID=1975037 RepID=A0A2M8LFQ0_9BACT|nr:MAG: hypothetical protein COV04_00170 [Candidatus Uhrbacteria bacterium CG10_big_fil_rev_8_21_14_0_10_48_11]
MTNEKKQVNTDYRWLNDPSLLRKMQGHFVSDVLKFNAVEEAQWLIKNIKPALEEKGINNLLPLALIDGYKELVTRASWLALSSLSEEEIIRLFATYFSFALDMSANLDVWEQLRAILIIRYPHDERDAFKAKLRYALEENQETITSNKLIIQEKEVLPTVANWLRDYVRHVDAQPAESIKQIEYLSSSINTKKISAQEKEKLHFLLHLYERLKRSTFSVDGLEEPLSTNIDGKEVTVKDGQVQQVDPRVERLINQFKKIGLITPEDEQPPSGPNDENDEWVDLRKAPLGSEVAGQEENKIDTEHVHARTSTVLKQSTLHQKERSALAAEEKATSSLFESAEVRKEIRRIRNNQINTKQLYDTLLTAFNVSRQAPVAAVLYALAEQGKLESFIFADQRFKNLLAARYRKLEKATMLRQLQEGLNYPEHLRNFLRMLLEDHMHMQISEAAHLAAELTALARKKDSATPYLAYFDEATQSYQWMDTTL